MMDRGGVKNATQFSGNYCLTDSGKKETIKIKRRLNIVEYYSLISKFPEIELRERIEALEYFAVASFFSATFIILINRIIFFDALRGDVYVALATMSFLSLIAIILSYHLVQAFLKIILVWIIGLQRDTLWIYKEWLWNNQNKILYPIPALFAIAVALVFLNMNIIQWDGLVVGLLMLALTLLITNYEKIVKKLHRK